MKKATFQKPDATYPHGSLREQPEYGRRNYQQPKIKRKNKKMDNDYPHGFLRVFREKIDFDDPLITYDIIPCSENNWKDGQELTFEVDYKLEECTCPFGRDVECIRGKKEDFYNRCLFAVPIVAQETEDEFAEFVKAAYQVLVGVGRQSMLEFISKSKFTLKRKTS